MIRGSNLPNLTSVTVNNPAQNNLNIIQSGDQGIIAFGVSGTPLVTGSIGFTGVGGLQLTLENDLNGFNGLIKISGSVEVAEVSTTGVLNPYSTIVYNHGRNSSNIQPKLYIRKNLSNNWEEPEFQYNDTFFEKSFDDYGYYDFKTGQNPFNGWSGINLGNCTMFGFSGGVLRCVTSATDTNAPTTSNTNTAPMLVKRLAGDFDVWAQITGVYTTNFHGNGIVAMSANYTGNVVASNFFILTNNFDSTNPVSQTKIRDIHGDSQVLMPRLSSSFMRISRVGNFIHSYVKTGIAEEWVPLIRTMSGRAFYNDVVRDEVFLGAYVQTLNTTSNGNAYTWSFFKSWSPIELRASGNNDLLIINNVGSQYDVKVVV